MNFYSLVVLVVFGSSINFIVAALSASLNDTCSAENECNKCFSNSSLNYYCPTEHMCCVNGSTESSKSLSGCKNPIENEAACGPPTTEASSTATTASTPSSTSPTVPDTTPTTIVPSKSTVAPNGRHFDAPSFIGGIVLALGLLAIFYVSFKFYKARTERNYHTL